MQLEGLHADSAATFPVGEVPPEVRRLLQVTQDALAAGIAQAKAGNHVGDIGHAVQEVAEAAGYSVVREMVGHGMGAAFHEEPQVPNLGKAKRGARLVAGMTIAIEPMVNVGRAGSRRWRTSGRSCGRRDAVGAFRAHRRDRREWGDAEDPHVVTG